MRYSMPSMQRSFWQDEETIPSEVLASCETQPCNEHDRDSMWTRKCILRSPLPCLLHTNLSEQAEMQDFVNLGP